MYREVRTLKQCFPCLLGGVMFGRSGNAEVLMVIVGPDDEAVALVIDQIFVPFLPGSHQYRFGGWIIRRDQPVLAGNVVASANDYVFVGIGVRNPEEEARIGLLVDHCIVLNGSTQHVQPYLVGVPGVVQRRIEE